MRCHGLLQRLHSGGRPSRLTQTQLESRMKVSSPDSRPAKNHFVILDGLRGVAALFVVVFHLFETYTLGDHFNQVLNHGYLLVDFFFMLSGFVIAYAYDDRWGAMSQWDFYKRRLIRLQPMVILGSVIGAAFFYFQTSYYFYKVGLTPVWSLLLVMIIGCLQLPLPRFMDVRGWDELYPLNGPAWSLFYEYIGNILYASALRKLSNRSLGLLVLVAAGLLLQLTLFANEGSVIGGYSLDFKDVRIGMTRLLFPFFAGVLLMRLGYRIRVRHAFAVCSALLVIAISIPRLGGHQHVWINGLYEALCVIVLFPLIIAMGAGGEVREGRSIRVARFFGVLSYPLYISHYPLIYTYTAWVVDNKIPGAKGAVVGVLLLMASIAIAYACLKLYDVPVRRWLSRRFLGPRAGDLQPAPSHPG